VAAIDVSEARVQASDFDSFFRGFEPVLSRALAAAFGFDVGRDAAAEALAYAWRNWNRVSTMDNPRGYVYRVGARWAARQRHAEVGPLLAPVVQSDGRFEPGLGIALSTLSLRQRQTVVLVAGFGLSQLEAARLLGLSRSSVQNHLERGMTKLRTNLGVSDSEH
jgi:DNA-directed RNA polymerase specialized sigma24 family protein